MPRSVISAVTRRAGVTSKGVIGGGAVRRRQADGDAPALIGPAFELGDLAFVAALDRDRRAALDLPVDRRRRQRDVKRDVVVARRQRLQIGADLVRDVAARRRAVAGRRARRAPRRSDWRPGCAGGSRRPRHGSECPHCGHGR